MFYERAAFITLSPSQMGVYWRAAFITRQRSKEEIQYD